MLPNTDHLFWLRHDADRFEAERTRLISEYIATVPEEHRASVQAFQSRIDAARSSMTPDQFLVWMQKEVRELTENMSDQFLAITHKAQDIKRALGSAE